MGWSPPECDRHLVCSPTRGQQLQISPDRYSEVKSRHIGPIGGRTTAFVGIPGNPNVYYAGAASGGIFKSTDGGIHWDSIFDEQPVSSIGSLAVALSDPKYRVGWSWRVF